MKDDNGKTPFETIKSAPIKKAKKKTFIQILSSSQAEPQA